MVRDVAESSSSDDLSRTKTFRKSIGFSERFRAGNKKALAEPPSAAWQEQKIIAKIRNIYQSCPSTSPSAGVRAVHQVATLTP